MNRQGAFGNKCASVWKGELIEPTCKWRVFFRDSPFVLLLKDCVDGSKIRNLPSLLSGDAYLKQ